jgi:hypothetical protein
MNGGDRAVGDKEEVASFLLAASMKQRDETFMFHKRTTTTMMD